MTQERENVDPNEFHPPFNSHSLNKQRMRNQMNKYPNTIRNKSAQS